MTRFEEDRSISCPPLFEGEAYFQWRDVMKYFIKAQDFEVWENIEDRFLEAPKKKKKQRSANDTKAKLNTKANTLFFAASMKKFRCKSPLAKVPKTYVRKVKSSMSTRRKRRKMESHLVLASSHHQRWMVFWLSMSLRIF